MNFKVTICSCNNLFGQGLREIIKQDLPNVDANLVSFKNLKDLFATRMDLLISDCNTFSRVMPLEEISEYKPKVLLLGAYCRPLIKKDHMLQLISNGLAGILPPTAGSTELIKAIRTILAGELWFERKEIKKIIVDFNIDDLIPSPQLTNKEKDIVKLICKGCRNKEIMTQLSISEQSVKSHLNRINKKCDVSDRLQLALYALKHWPELSQ